MPYSWFRLPRVYALMPIYDNSGFWADGEPNPYQPENNPFRGIRTYPYSQVSIYGQTLQPVDLAAGQAPFAGPAEGDLMILWLAVRGGFVDMNAGWFQHGNSLSDGRVTHLYEQIPGQGIYKATWAPTGTPSPLITGGWTRFVTVDHGGNGPKIFGYWRECSRAEADSLTRWRINLAASGEVYSQVHVQFIPAQYWRKPFTPTVNSRTYVNTMSWRVPGVRTPITPDADATGTGAAGGNLILSTTVIHGQYSTTAPGGGIDLNPGQVLNEQYGYYFYFAYPPPYGWGWTWRYAGGIPDDTVIPDGAVNTQRPDASILHVSSVTLAIPPPPNVTIPDTTTPAAGLTNTFEVDNLASFFTTSGSGTPWIG